MRLSAICVVSVFCIAFISITGCGGSPKPDPNTALPPVSVAPKDGCVLYYDFQDIGKTVKDLSGCNNHGRVNEARSCVGVNGEGAYFHEGSASVIVPLSDTLKQFSALTVEVWASPEAIRHAGLVWGAATSDIGKQQKTPIRFDWRGPSWKFWLLNTMEDGEQRAIQPPNNVVKELTFPEPTWYHVVATNDGEEMALYINGKRLARRKYKVKKAIAPIKEALLVGNGYQSPWSSYQGKLDEVRIYNRALSADEVKAHFAAKASFKPMQVKKEFPGTLDGKAFSPIGFRKQWLKFALAPATLGQVAFSNTGEVQISSGSGWAGTYHLGIFGVWGQRGSGDKFYTDMTGRISLTPPGEPNSMEIEGTTRFGTKVKQKVVITPENEVKCRYEITGGKKGGATIGWPFHMWESAMSFVSTEEGRLVKGRLMDLARTVRFEDTTELTLARGGARLLVRLAPGLVWHIEGTRNPVRWINGWTTLSGLIKQKDSPKRPQHGNGVLEFSLQVVDDSLPPVLKAEAAKEITPEKPFDYSELNEGVAGCAQIKTIDREAPIFGFDEQVKLELRMDDPGKLKIYPDYMVTIHDVYSGKEVSRVPGKVSKPWWEWIGCIYLSEAKPSVYKVTAVFTDANGKQVDSASIEIAVVGPIAQPVRKPDEPLKLKLVDSVDLTLDKPGHDFYSGSNKSQVVTVNGAKYRRLLSYFEMRSLGVDRRDFVGVKMKMRDKTKDHVVEVVYADLDDSIIGINILEPIAQDGKESRYCLTRATAGAITGGYFKHDGKLKSTKTEYIPTGRVDWVAVTCQNHYITTAGVAKINLYEVAGGFPRLPSLSHDRLIGVHTESGNVGLGTFAHNMIAGEFNWRVPPEKYYSEHYRAIENLIRFLRFRGENVYNFGVYRYRQAQFPSKIIGSGLPSRRLDLPGLTAKMFAYNDLKILMNVAACQPVNIARHYRNSTWDAIQGAHVARQVSKDGKMDAGHFGYQPGNPFHPAIQDEYRKYAVELAERYGKLKSFAGISWLNGAMGLGEPCVFQWGYGLKKDNKKGFDNLFFKYSYDDGTMEQFEKFARVKLPGKVGDPKRFAERYKWIMANAKEKWIDFRCRAMSDLHKSYKKTFTDIVPNAKYYLFDYFGVAFYNEVMHMDGLEMVRKLCSDPRYYANLPGMVYCPYVPTLDGSQYKKYAHGLAEREVAMATAKFARREKFYTAADTGIECGRYLHRQFFETHTVADSTRPWIFERGKRERKQNYICHNNYPQPTGRNWFADFATMLAYATPNFISWMWCDGSYPSGHYKEMREFTFAWRQLPLGVYKTIKSKNGVFVRSCPKAFYIVEIDGNAGEINLPAALTGRFKDIVTGVEVGPGEKVSVRPYEFRVFVKK